MADDSQSEGTVHRSQGGSPRKQQIVNLDIGGKTFKILRSNLERFPQSLIAQMVDDFSDLLESEEPLHININRNPNGFEWILEIYRTGSYRGLIPHMSQQEILDELDFYQLPSPKDLGLDMDRAILSKQEHAKEFAEKIVSEIKICGLQHLFPWKVFIYYKCKDKKIDTVPSVFVEPPYYVSHHSVRRGHETFNTARLVEPKDGSRVLCEDKLTIRRNNSPYAFVCRILTGPLLRHFVRAMAGHGLSVTTKKDEVRGWKEEYRIQFLLVDCEK